MNAAGAELLEYHALKQLLQRYLSSPLGRKQLQALVPTSSREELEEVLAQTSEAIEHWRASSRPQPAVRGAAVRLHFDSLPDPTEILAKLRIEGTCLDGKEILELCALMDASGEVRRILASVAGRFPRLAAFGRRLAEFHPLPGELTARFLPDGTLADHASPELSRLRHEIERQRRLVQESLERFVERHREDGLLQEDFVTIRNDRFVVPVVAGRQRRIDGVVHGSSGSGHTLFVEPLETIELNNELVRLHEEELREVHRILLETSQRLRERCAAIQSSAEVLGELEWLFAKAAFAADFQCSLPRFCAQGPRRLLLKKARHPLLEDVLRHQSKSPVPISLELDEQHRTLLVSGPNTGGKTVTLKTVGLLALMAQSGLPLPCEEAELPVFKQVLADIGDNQSIQESLSTFSAHVNRLRQMIEMADAGALVLLDELGRATDPEEGGALGVAVLEHFRTVGAFTIASTHLLALKAYGATTPGVLNAGMGFNENTLEPTYILRLGAPGKSAGLEIARRLGMPRELMEQARQRLTRQEQDIARFLAELEKRLEQTARLTEELNQQKETLAARERALAKEWAERETAKLKEIDRRCQLALERFEAQARETIQRILSDATQKKEAARAMRQVARVKRELQHEMEVTALAARDESRRGELEKPKIAEGARVRLKGLAEPAQVRRLLGEGKIEVQAGFMKLQVSSDEVLEVLPPAEGRRLPPRISFDAAPLDAGTVREINVIGRHADEACQIVEKALDNAILAGVTRLRVVHGHGMGVLKRAVATLLTGHPYVEKFYPAEPHEGGAGATIVELKS
ncbi:MAG: endonuclease MutS2 [Bryobacteraceae bacterium]